MSLLLVQKTSWDLLRRPHLLFACLPRAKQNWRSWEGGRSRRRRPKSPAGGSSSQLEGHEGRAGNSKKGVCPLTGQPPELGFKASNVNPGAHGFSLVNLFRPVFSGYNSEHRTFSAQ